MDPLTSTLRLLNLRASVYFHSEFCGNWGIHETASYRATFHRVTGGHCCMTIEDTGEQLYLKHGDLVVFTRQFRYTISSAVENYDDSDDNAVGLVCGYFEFDSLRNNPILDAMPEVLHISGSDIQEAGMFASILEFISLETESSQPGSDVIVDRLSEVLFIHVVRAYIQQHDIQKGMLALLVDARLSSAIRAVHENPGHNWQVSTLAQRAAMSRSSFASRFQQRSGITPMQYVTNWRMQCAFERLRQGEESVATVAESLGYQTEAAFRKAFRKHAGIGPGELRRESA